MAVPQKTISAIDYRKLKDIAIKLDDIGILDLPEIRIDHTIINSIKIYKEHPILAFYTERIK